MNEFQSPSETASEHPDSDGEPPEPGSELQIPIANEQAGLTIDQAQLEAAVRLVFRDSAYNSGLVSIAVVDDPTIHQINRQYLDHDYPTDVLSFVLQDNEPRLEGELVVSTDTAASESANLSWSAHDELILYVVHGALHLVGYLDKTPDEAAAMHAAEAKVLTELGITLPDGDNRWSASEENRAGESNE